MGRKIVFIRHGERFDFALGRNWFETCFDSHGHYDPRQSPTNLPATLLVRQGMPETYRHDCPLTLTGLEQGRSAGQKIVGDFLNVQDNDFDVYVSPALRSVQTAAAILEGMEFVGGKKLKIEPSLFEWAGFCLSHGLPKWMTVQELIDGGYQIDTEYQPFLTHGRVDTRESVGQYYRRTNDFVSNILSRNENDILMVGHSATPDAGTRQLCGKAAPTTFAEMVIALRSVPYAGFAVAEKQEKTGTWILIKSAHP